MRVSISLFFCQVGLDNGHQIEQVIAQRRLVLVRSPLGVVPLRQTLWNAENGRRRLETSLQSKLLYMQAVCLQLRVVDLHLQSCLKICVFGGVCLEGAHPSVNDALAEDLKPSIPSLEFLWTSVKPLKVCKT